MNSSIRNAVLAQSPMRVGEIATFVSTGTPFFERKSNARKTNQPSSPPCIKVYARARDI